MNAKTRLKLWRGGALSLSVVSLLLIMLTTAGWVLLQASSRGCGGGSGGGCGSCGGGSCQNNGCDTLCPLGCSEYCKWKLDLFNEGLPPNHPCSSLGTVCTSSATISAKIVLHDTDGNLYTLVDGNLPIGADGTTPEMDIKPCIPGSALGIGFDPAHSTAPTSGIVVHGCPCPDNECTVFTIDMDPTTAWPEVDPTTCVITLHMGVKPLHDGNNNPVCFPCPAGC